MYYQTANYVLILCGVLLVASGPWISYKTIKGMVGKRKADPTAKLQWGSNIVNILIAVAFFLAGICFIVNNLRGNPLPPAG